MRRPTLYVMGALGTLIIGIPIFRFLVIEPREVRAACNKEAIEWIKKRASTRQVYPSAERDDDYKFSYEACFRKHGLNPQ